MFNPIIASENIKKSYIDYIVTLKNIDDNEYSKAFRAALNKEGMISKGPFLDLSGSYEKGHSLAELIKSKEVCSLFAELEKVPEEEKELKIERPLYKHQEAALSIAKKKENIVVTTGTGSGKTECFLLPIINELLLQKQNGALTAGVRALIIYPMNALANDQIKRLRKLLTDCPDITFGVYNGDTKHNQQKALTAYKEMYGGTPQANELISREQMQKTPPNILITNYSMLEYMMLRPKDDLVFSDAKLKYIVLDEAHIYRGATGIETSVLMRRLQARISNPKNVQYILTSATLGGEEANQEIIDFAETLCRSSFKAENIVRSKEVHEKMVDSIDFPIKMFVEIASGENDITKILQKYNADFSPNANEKEKLYDMLLHSSLFGNLRNLALNNNNVLTIAEIAKKLNLSKQELVAFITVASKAVKDGDSLIKARYHFFLRALEGAYISLRDKDYFSLVRKDFDEKHNKIFEIATCETCGRVAISGQTEEDKILHHSSQMHDDKTEYYVLKQNSTEEFIEPDSDDEKIEDGDYVICSLCGAIAHESIATSFPPCEHEKQEYIKIRESGEKGKCPACGFGEFQKFYLGYEAATAVLATSLFEELPDEETVFVEQENNIQTNSFFSNIPDAKKVAKKVKAKQFLAFSDSRADAAYFSSYMENRYKEFLRRRGAWHICETLQNEGTYRIDTLSIIDRIDRLFQNSGSFAELGKAGDAKANECREQACIAILDELASSKRTSSLTSLGKIKFVYAPKNEQKKVKWNAAISTIASHLNNNVSQAEAYLNLIIADFISAGALNAGENFLLNDAELEYLFRSPVAKKMILRREGARKSWLTPFIPRQRTGKTKSYFKNTRLSRTMRALGFNETEAIDFLTEFWEKILEFENGEYSLSIEDFDVLLPQKGQTGFSFACQKCHKITPFNMDNKCANLKCSGELAEFDSSVNEDNHYVKLYSINKIKPFYIKEHTAQLSREKALEYQKLFVEKKLHALSSSTTFEMGVDVGSLETVFLRDIPPTPANYVQRAGRAGRSLDSAAYALCYAKLSSHDFTYFDEPKFMIKGEIKAPNFSIENEKIMRRHINAVVLSYFFAHFPEIYNNNDQTEFLCYGGYEKLKEVLATRPVDLLNLLKNSIPNSVIYGINDWSFIEFIIGENAPLELAVNDFRKTVELLEKELENCKKNNDDKEAFKFSNKLKYYRGDANKGEPRKQIIDFLVRNNILPKYGFPVDTIELMPEPFSSYSNNSKHRPTLQRDLQMAIAEYAPGSQIVADGKLYTSRYIRKLNSAKASNWEYGWFATCGNQNCKATNFYKDTATRENLKCISCGTPIMKKAWQRTIEPRQGFISDKPNEKIPSKKPERSYKTDDCYIGDQFRHTINKQIFEVNGKRIIVESTANDSLVVLTHTKFKVCQSCGYAVGDNDIIYKKEHYTPYGKKCKNEEEGVEYFLSHDFKTDVLRITFDSADSTDYNIMLSVLYALLESISKVLDIERNDINGCLYKTVWQGQLINNIIIYDATAGGAGHVRRVITDNGDVLKNVIKTAVDICNACDCEPSCYKCLRNYYNQKIHDDLDRAKAKNFLQGFVGNLLQIKESEIAETIIAFSGTTLKGDYSDWNETKTLLADFDLPIEQFQNSNIPLANLHSAVIKFNDETIETVLLWGKEKIAIAENVSPENVLKLASNNWNCFDLKNFDVEKFTNAFKEGANNG